LYLDLLLHKTAPRNDGAVCFLPVDPQKNEYFYQIGRILRQHHFCFYTLYLPKYLDFLFYRPNSFFMNLTPSKWYRALRLMQTNPLVNQPDTGGF
jgi:hypothetical protein